MGTRSKHVSLSKENYRYIAWLSQFYHVQLFRSILPQLLILLYWKYQALYRAAGVVLVVDVFLVMTGRVLQCRAISEKYKVDICF